MESSVGSAAPEIDLLLILQGPPGEQGSTGPVGPPGDQVTSKSHQP